MHWLLSGRLQVERFAVAIADLPPALTGTKLVQLSDLHYDYIHLSEEMLAEAIALSNREDPDLVLLTGDYVTNEPEPIDELVLRLKHLRSRAGIYAVLGNHDLRYPHSRTTVTDAFTRIGVHVLWNAIAYPFGSSLPIIGLADYWSPEYRLTTVANLMAQLAPQTPRIVLSHNPDSAEGLQPWRVDLQLSGHTHGGQMIVPGWGPAALLLKPARRYIPKPLQALIPFLQECSRVVDHWEWAQGWHCIGQNKLYVNRGLGTYFPGRLFCPPEVTVMTLNRI